ncbi:MAG: DUF2318 domain-containing protein [Eggerthellaceae bacterium]|nr:DUF2318 domain-containing protein [Eggerthellaceae bacterium]
MANTRSQITESPRAKRTARLAAALALALTLALALVGCTVSKPSSFADATVEEGYVVISKADIGPQALFVNYDADGVTVQLLAVQSTDGEPHVALNTCQSCNPSPKAFFEQDADTLTCNNCGLEFSVDTVGAVGASACNPAPVQGLVETDDAFIVPVAILEAYAPFFEQWQGPTK